jgi:hypothetical protein
MAPPGLLRSGIVALSPVPGRSLFAFLGQHQIVLASPYPPAECGRRLEAATGRRLFGSFGSLPLQGRVSPDLIRVARRPPFGSRNSLVAWFTGRIEQSPDGGTLVPGTVGPEPATTAVFAAISAVWLVVGGTMFTVGLSSLGSRHPELPLLLIPIAFAAAYVLILVFGPAMARKEIRELLDELNAILDSTDTFPRA